MLSMRKFLMLTIVLLASGCRGDLPWDTPPAEVRIQPNDEPLRDSSDGSLMAWKAKSIRSKAMDEYIQSAKLSDEVACAEWLIINLARNGHSKLFLYETGNEYPLNIGCVFSANGFHVDTNQRFVNGRVCTSYTIRW